MLDIYFDVTHTDKISSDGSGSNPDYAEAGGEGGARDKKLYLWSDNPAKTYEDIQITAGNDTPEFAVQYARDAFGNPSTFYDHLSMPNGDYVSPVAFWRRVTFAVQSDSITLRSVRHTLSAAEYAK